MSNGTDANQDIQRDSRKRVICDSSSLISMSMSCMVPVVAELSDYADFIITKTVYDEIITNPLAAGHHMIGPLQFKALVEQGILNVETAGNQEVDDILHLSNNTYYAHGNPMQIIQRGEAEALALANKGDVMLVDERTLRFLIESPKQLRELLEYRTHHEVSINFQKRDQFQKFCDSVGIIRSSELVAIAYEKGILDKYFSGEKHQVLKALLWSLKSHGCSLSEEDINEYLNMLK